MRSSRGEAQQNRQNFGAGGDGDAEESREVGHITVLETITLNVRSVLARNCFQLAPVSAVAEIMLGPIRSAPFPLKIEKATIESTEAIRSYLHLLAGLYSGAQTEATLAVGFYNRVGGKWQFADLEKPLLDKPVKEK
jgi:hypothetical protein